MQSLIKYARQIALKEEQKQIWSVYYSLDMIFSKLIHGISLGEYDYWSIYNIPFKLRRNFFTIKKRNQIVQMHNNRNSIQKVEDKNIFLNAFKEFTGRSYLKVREHDYQEFLNFIKKHKYIVAKDAQSSQGRKVKFINTSEYANLNELYKT